MIDLCTKPVKDWLSRSERIVDSFTHFLYLDYNFFGKTPTRIRCRRKTKKVQSSRFNVDGFVKSLESHKSVIPAKAGIQ
jgi:hypothetical protein